MSAIDFTKLADAVVAENNIDMTQAQTGGVDREPPAAGPCRLRFVTYVELGKQNDTFQGKPVVKEKVILGFEVSGPKHPPIELPDGTKVPHYIEFDENFSLNEKANFFKLFQRMNYAGSTKHIVGLLGQAFLGTVYHRAYKGRDGKERIAAELHSKTEGVSIRPPRVEDPETGEFRNVTVAPPTLPIRCFVWGKPDRAQWDSLFIDGEWPEVKDDSGKVTRPARSKNKYQLGIKGAVNFPGSPVFQLLAGAQDVDLGVQAESGKAALAGESPSREDDDPLNGVGV